MKTIEEKAKAYDEIVERAKTMLSAGEVMYGKENNASQLIIDIIPELAESEDEKIRKEIIDYFKSRLSTAEEAEILYFKCWIAYLEKQKEPKPISAVEVLARAGLKPYKDGNQWCILAGDNIQEGICGFGDTIDEALYQFLMEVLEMQKEQKPAWSEEETKDLVHILKVLDDCYAYGRHDLSKTDHDNLTSMIKSLPPSWKPSRAQMSMLLAVINEPNNASSESCHLALAELYEELKKLM